jgi:hypothetical protein
MCFIHHVLHPDFLVGGGKRAGEDDVGAVVADRFVHDVEQGFRDGLVCGLVDEELAIGPLRVGIEGQDVDAAVAGFPDEGRHRLRIVGGHADHVVLLGDPGFEHADLAVVRRFGRAVERHLDVQLAAGFASPLLKGIEVGNAGQLGHQTDPDLAAA